MAGEKGGGMRPRTDWQPGCQCQQPLPGPAAAATGLPRQVELGDRSETWRLNTSGNLVATQEGH